MPDRAFSPITAFGLRATSIALKAKCARATRQDAQALIDCAIAHVPQDTDALAATIAFDTGLPEDQHNAGAALFDFVLGWAPELAPNATRIEKTLRDQTPQFDWQLRRDTGLD